MLASMRAPYLDGMLQGKQGRKLPGGAAGNQGQMDRRHGAEAIQTLGNTGPRQGLHAVLVKRRERAVVVQHQQR